MSNLYLPSNLPLEARINYMAVLSSLENYRMPTDQNISVEDIINRKMYAWYQQEKVLHSHQVEETDWYLNLE